MNHEEARRFECLFQTYLNALTLQGKQPKTIEAYALAVRQAAVFFDCCPDQLSVEQLQAFFLHLIQTRSWSKVKIARNGLQSFYQTPYLAGCADGSGSLAADQCDDTAALSGVLSGHVHTGLATRRDAWR